MSANSVSRKWVGVAMIAMAVGVSGCGGRPSTDALTDSILRASEAEQQQMSKDQAECIAESLLTSDLNDVTVTGLAENFDQPEVAGADADEVKSLVANAAVSCAGE